MWNFIRTFWAYLCNREPGPHMKFAVEAWTIPTDGDEEPCNKECVESDEFTDENDAMAWAWNRMEEGFFVRLWRR